MDPTQLLNFENRNGYSTQDIDDFLSKADSISKAIERLHAGEEIDEKELTQQIPGYKSEADILAEKNAQERRKRELEEQEKQKKLLLKQEEHDSWWYRAKLKFQVEEEDENDLGLVKDEDESIVNRIVQAYKDRDANDYSEWNKWVPDDPVTREEKEQKEKVLNAIRNEEFEKANPGFCTQFRQDMDERNEALRDKTIKGQSKPAFIHYYILIEG